MGSDRPSIGGIVVVTICLTAVVLVGGWLVASRYLGQPTVKAAREEVPAASAPRRKPVRSGRGLSQNAPTHDNASVPDRAAQPVAHTDATAVPQSNELSSAPGGSGTSVSAQRDPEAAIPVDRGDDASRAAAVDSTDRSSAPGAGGDARTIMEEAQRRAEARFYRYDGLLQSFDTRERITEKQWTFDREGSHGQSKAVLRFTAPAEVKGVALLIMNHPERASDQWMWTPAIERDRRISLQDRSTRFFGTDFSFEDLEERDVDQYTYAMLGTEVIDGAECWKIQLVPKPTRSSQYSRGIAWIRQDNYAYVRLDDFLRNDVIRRLTYSGIENIQGIWTARQLDMADLRHGTHTRLTLRQVKYNAPMRDDDFTVQAIRR